jgi:predicted Zn-dependent protease
MGVAELSGRWLRARRALRREDQIFAERLADMAKRHASEGFDAFDDPLEAAVFSVLIEILKRLEGDVDP